MDEVHAHVPTRWRIPDSDPMRSRVRERAHERLHAGAHVCVCVRARVRVRATRRRVHVRHAEVRERPLYLQRSGA